MINLMYLVFIAMMALNVSSEVLDGFELVEGSLRTSIDNTSTRNEIVTEELKAYYQTNPEKVREWYEKGTKVKEASDSLYNYVQDLKVRIAQIADGKDADVNNIDHKDDLEAASRVMLSPVSGEGKKLRQSIEKLPDTDGRDGGRLGQRRASSKPACRQRRLTRPVSILALGKRLCSRICR